MLMNSDRRGVDEQVERIGKSFLLQGLPQAFPDTALFPSTEADVDMVPMSHLRRKIAPGTAGSCDPENCFDEVAVGLDRRAACCGMLRLFDDRFELLPNFRSDDLSLGT